VLFFPRKFRERKRLIEEFKALLHVVPVNVAQMQWICRTLDDFEYKHPELELQIIAVLEAFKPREETTTR
jgi:hypothetical protein